MKNLANERTEASRLSFRQNENGSMSAMIGLSMLAICVAIGAAIDFGRVTAAQQRLAVSMDAAVLHVAKISGKSQAELQRIAQDVLIANYGTDNYDEVSSFTLKAVPGKVSATANVRVKTWFMSIVGYRYMDVPLFSEVSSAVNADIYTLVDTSPSMALAVTSSGISTMRNLTRGKYGRPAGCAFACHQTDLTYYGGYRRGNPLYQRSDNNPVTNELLRNNAGQWASTQMIARERGIELRVDAARRALSDLTTAVTSAASRLGGTFRMGAYSFDLNFRTNAPLTSSIPAFKTGADTIKLMPVYRTGQPYQGVSNHNNDTQVTDAMKKMLKILPAKSGRGSAQPGDSPRAFLFIISDGMRNEKSPETPEPYDASLCQQVKDRGITVAILYTKYIAEAIEGDLWSDQHVKIPLLDSGRLEDALKQCASPGLLRTVVPDQDMSVELQQLFNDAMGSMYLSG